jgi:hypothetical protein
MSIVVRIFAFLCFSIKMSTLRTWSAIRALSFRNGPPSPRSFRALARHVVDDAVEASLMTRLEERENELAAATFPGR